MRHNNFSIVVQLRKALYLSTFVIAAGAITSCNSFDRKEVKQSEAKTPEAVQEKSSYLVDGKIVIDWTAYKFTEKAKVGGTLDSVKLTLANESGDVADLLTGAQIEIFTGSVNSNNEARDLKIVNYFFETFNTEVIKGKVLSVSTDDGTMELVMNNISQEVDYTYNVEGDTLHLTALIDLLNWNGDAALNSLNEVCYELHKGSDGISKLWPNLTIDVFLPLKRS